MTKKTMSTMQECIIKKALDLQPNNNEALLGLSSIYEKTGNPRQAQEYLKKAVELAPSNTELILKYAESLVKAKSFFRGNAIHIKDY